MKSAAFPLTVGKIGASFSAGFGKARFLPRDQRLDFGYRCGGQFRPRRANRCVGDRAAFRKDVFADREAQPGLAFITDERQVGVEYVAGGGLVALAH